MSKATTSPSRPQQPPGPHGLTAEQALPAEAAGRDEEWLDEAEWGAAETEPAGGQGGWPEREGVVKAAELGQRLDAWLVSLAPEYSRNHLKGLIESGCVQVDGRFQENASRKVVPGQTVRVQLRPTAQSQAFVAEAMDLPIFFEDDHLLIVNKPAGLVVHPAAGHWQGTLMNGLLAHHPGAASLARAGIVHRLDKDTSGLMVVGKTLEAVTALSRAIAERTVRRQYVALVHGAVDEPFTVDAPIGRDPVSRIRMAVLASGKPARTDVRRLMQGHVQGHVQGNLPPPDGGQGSAPELRRKTVSLLECTLHTGRTHQIRVHLSSRKLPLVADALYGGAPALGMTRQALHAFRLAFDHPLTGESLLFEAPLPEDMAQAVARLRGGSAGTPSAG